jgi:hypothetical protein
MQVAAPQIRIGGLVMNDNGEENYLASYAIRKTAFVPCHSRPRAALNSLSK